MEEKKQPLIPGAEPIFHHQGETGLLFLHGFTGSPYEGQDFAAYFSQKGYGIWVPLLPGHGTRPEDLVPITHNDWLQAAENYYLEMKKKYQKVIVCGQSMGGTLALHLGATYPLDGLITLAAAIILKDWRLSLLPIARRLFRYQYKSKGADIRDKKAKERSATYHKYPIKSLLEFLTLLDYVKSELPSVNCPTLMIHARKDHTITYENLTYISERISSPCKQILSLENSYHVISVDEDKLQIFEKIDFFLKNLLQELNT